MIRSFSGSNENNSITFLLSPCFVCRIFMAGKYTKTDIYTLPAGKVVESSRAIYNLVSVMQIIKGKLKGKVLDD
jgi:hypothetical protein